MNDAIARSKLRVSTRVGNWFCSAGSFHSRAMCTADPSVIKWTCFCKAMCYFVNKESSDFTLSQDVSCDLSLSEKQAFLWAELRVHMASEHGKFQDKDVPKHSKITCYEASPVIK